ncbi:MAG: hypothetical protein MRQ09_02195 [Candidatus Midichloria sp.]|nr:hypothetical protein [Candidatus Midichloria sp.]
MIDKLAILAAGKEAEFGYQPLTSLLKFEEDLRKGINLEEAYSYFYYLIPDI